MEVLICNKMRLLTSRMIKKTCHLTVKSCKLFCSQTTGARWQNVWWDCCSNIPNSTMVGCQFWSETFGFCLVKPSFGVHSSWFWTKFEQFPRNLHKQLANRSTPCAENTSWLAYAGESVTVPSPRQFLNPKTKLFWDDLNTAYNWALGPKMSLILQT